MSDIMPWHEERTVTIASGTVTTSGTADLGDYTNIGMLIPPMTTSTGSLSFDVSDDAGNYYRLNGTDGSEHKESIGVGSMAIARIDELTPVKYVRCVVSATQASERIITFLCKT